MALPSIVGAGSKKRDQMLAVDLGSRNTKAVYLQRQGDTLVLSRFAVLDAPIFEKSLSPELLSEHLRAVTQALETKPRLVALTTNVNEALVRHVDMPKMPLEDMRLILKHNSRNYLQQDLANYVFDCHVLPSAAVTTQKQKVLVAGGKKQLVDDYVNAAKSAALVADHIVPGLIGPVNAFEMAMPDAFANDVVALVDVGFRSSSICILQQGELILSRVVGIGGDRLTAAISEAMNISYAEAEGIKVGMAGEVQSVLESVLMPLGRELRASIDFFEHQQDRSVSAAYLTGGSTRSEYVVQALQQELMIEARTWNPTSFLKLDLSPQQAGEIEHASSQLAVAVGVAVTAL
jgi:type IV pilus assembly protein PilM